jgi:hypothetical protein
MITIITISDRIKMFIAHCGLSIADFARLKKTSAQNIHNKLSRNNWTIKDLQEYSDILDAELDIEFKLKTGENYKIF